MHLPISVYFVFPLSHEIPCSHFFPGRGINSGLSEDVWRDRVTGSLIPQVIGPFIACDSTPAALHSAGETEKSKREKERERLNERSGS